MKNLILTEIPIEELKTAVTEAVKTEVERLILHQQPKTEAEYLNRRETARLLGISLPTLNCWTKKGIIPAYRISSAIRYKRAEVEEALKQVVTIKYGRDGRY